MPMNFYSCQMKPLLQTVIKQFPAVLITGPRQVWKSTLLQHICEDYQYVTFDDTIKRWTTILETSGIIYLLKPYSNNHLKRAIKTPKVYMLDTGLMAWLTKWLTPETIQQGAKSGQFFETFVVSEIIKSFYNSDIEPPLYFYRDTNQKEID